MQHDVDNGRTGVAGQSLEDSLNAVVLAGLQPLAAGVAVIYIVFVAMNLTGKVLPDYAFMPVVAMDLVMMIISGTCWLMIRGNKVPVRWAHPVTGLLAALLLINVLCTLWILKVPYHTLYVALILVGAGCFLLSLRWLLVVIVITVAAWAPVAWRFADVPDFAYYALSVFAAAVLAVVVHRSRVESYSRIHELRQADALNRERLAWALEDSEGRYRQIVETASEGIGITDSRGVITYVNPRITEILGYAFEELIGIAFVGLIHEDDREEVGRRVANREEVGSEVYESRFVHKDGSTVWISVSASTLYDANGEFVGGLGLLTDITVRKKALETIWRSEQHYRGVFDGAFDSIIIFDPETEEVLDVNRHACKSYGFDRTEFQGMSLRTISKDVERGIEFIQKTLKIVGHHRFESVHYRKDGSEMVVEMNASVVDYGGRPAILSINREITERHRLEQSRERYSRRLEALQEVDRAILAAKSPPDIARAVVSRVVDLVPCAGACVLLREPDGSAVSTVCSMDCGEACKTLSAEDFNTCRTCWETDSVHIEDTAKTEMSCVIADGVTTVAVRSLVCEPMSFDGEQLGGLLLVSSEPEVFEPEHREIARELADMLGLSLHQAHLRHSADSEYQRLRAIVDCLPEAIMVLDHERHILFANPPAERDLDLLVGRQVGEQLETVAGEPLANLLSPVEEGGWHSLSVTTEPVRYFEAAATRIEAGEQLSGYVVVIRDVTHDKQVRRQVQAQERLAAVGQLAAGIAHDFNNILQTILMSGELLRQNRHLSSEDIEQTNAIIRQTSRASTLVRQILDFSRKSVRTGRPLDIARALGETVQLLRRTIREQVALVFEIEDASREYCVRGDSAQIEQLITNLVINSQDALPEGGEVRLTLAIVEVLDDSPPPFPGMAPGRWVELRVADDGIGIPTEIQGRVYEPFFSTKAPGKGTGLGLAQVYGIVKQHEGFIDLKSEPGQGTAFSVFLPWIAAKAEDSDSMGHPVVRRGQGEVVVVVEDEAPLLGIISRALSSFGYDVRATVDADEAVQICEQLADTVDLVISDVVMPKMSGPDLLASIRSTCPRARFVLMSGYPLDEHPSELSQAEEFKWLQKPFSVRHLVEVVNLALGTAEQS